MVRLVDQDEPVLVFTGYVLPELSKERTGTFQVKMAKDSVVTLPVKIQEFFSFMATPRLREDVYIAIANAGGNIADVDRMLETDLIRVVPPGQTDLSLDALVGLKLIPMGFKVNKQDENENSIVVYVGGSEDATDVFPISTLLADILWDDVDEDFPASVRRIGLESGWRSDIAIRLALADLDGLLGHGFARWENLLEPKQAIQRQVLTQVAEEDTTNRSPFARIKNLLLSKKSDK